MYDVPACRCSMYVVQLAGNAHLYVSLLDVMQIKLSHNPIHVLSLILPSHNDSYFTFNGLRDYQVNCSNRMIVVEQDRCTLPVTGRFSECSKKITVNDMCSMKVTDACIISRTFFQTVQGTENVLQKVLMTFNQKPFLPLVCDRHTVA
jgi:hypothetical protein